MIKYKVKFFNHISINNYTLDQARERVEYLNSTFKGCNARIVEKKEIDLVAELYDYYRNRWKYERWWEKWNQFMIKL